MIFFNEDRGWFYVSKNIIRTCKHTINTHNRCHMHCTLVCYIPFDRTTGIIKRLFYLHHSYTVYNTLLPRMHIVNMDSCCSSHGTNSHHAATMHMFSQHKSVLLHPWPTPLPLCYNSVWAALSPEIRSASCRWWGRNVVWTGTPCHRDLVQRCCLVRCHYASPVPGSTVSAGGEIHAISALRPPSIELLWSPKHRKS